MIVMVRDGDHLRCTGLLEAVLPNTPEGWGQLSRAARAAHLMPPEVDKATQQFRFLPARRPQDADRAWEVNVSTQRAQVADAERRLVVARNGLVRLGEFVEGVAPSTKSPIAAPSTPPTPSSSPAPPEAVAAPVAPAPPPDPKPAAPATPPTKEPRLRVDIVTDAQAIAISAVMAAAREAAPVEWFKLGVCALVLEGREAALAIEGMPAKAVTRLRSMSDKQAREQALKWAAEAVR